MDTPITKRLLISGLTTSITADDISRRLTTFGTVKALDGFGLPDGVGQPRKFGYVTLETTTGKLAKCMNLLSGSTWKGAKLRFGEAKPDFRERIALENKAAAETPPKKRRKRGEGSQAEDMTLVTSANVSDREGWQVSSLGRITRPVRMRPERPLPEIEHEKPKSTLKKEVRVGAMEGEKKKSKRFKDPDSRARRKTIDMTKWGSTHLKGMFLDMPALGTKRLKLDDIYDPAVESEDNEESGDDSDTLKVSQPSEHHVISQMTLSPSPPPLPTNAGNISANIPTLLTSSTKPQSSVREAAPLPDNNTDLEVEKTQSLNLLASLFGGQDDSWVRPESVGSDIDVDELMKGDIMLVDDDDDGIEVVPHNLDVGMTRMKELQEEEENQPETKEKEGPLAGVTSTKSTQVKPQTSTTLKDLFAPREEEAGFSLLGHLDLDLELDNEPPFFTEQPTATLDQTPAYTPLPPTTLSSQAPTVLNPKQALFFPHPQKQGILNKVRQKDVFDLIKDNHWNWRDPSVGFYRTGTEEDIRKRWEEGKSELTKEWKKRWREAGKANRRRRGTDVDIEY
ncbi:hypothetical protein BYT27DRAFT_7108757 [Phlegmacium glaucopus]|nr:hypothetical protein BYT27DRAFT_7108757 [Phlegmacium glaucopus]